MKPSWTMHEIDSIVKPSTIWDRNNYMNIWSINIQDPSAPGVDGFGTFPASTSDTTDGVVIANWVFGSENGNKTIVGTHEVGHYLNLKHVWGDNQPNCGDDLVNDTPPSAKSNEGCPTFPHNANNICGTGVNGEMFMNYMDYSDAPCTVMFTNDQVDRMQATLLLERASLMQSNGCDALSPPLVFDLALRKTMAPGSKTIYKVGDVVTFNITVFNQGTLAATSVDLVDYIPTGLTLQPGSDWTLDGDKARWIRAITNLAPGAQETVTISFTVNSAAAGVIINTAEISDVENAQNLEDIDSNPDDIKDNDGTVKNNEIRENGKMGGDEDDHDIEPITVCPNNKCVTVKLKRKS